MVVVTEDHPPRRRRSPNLSILLFAPPTSKLFRALRICTNRDPSSVFDLKKGFLERTNHHFSYKNIFFGSLFVIATFFLLFAALLELLSRPAGARCVRLHPLTLSRCGGSSAHPETVCRRNACYALTGSFGVPCPETGRHEAGSFRVCRAGCAAEERPCGKCDCLKGSPSLLGHPHVCTESSRAPGRDLKWPAVLVERVARVLLFVHR